MTKVSMECKFLKFIYDMVSSRRNMASGDCSEMQYSRLAGLLHPHAEDLLSFNLTSMASGGKDPNHTVVHTDFHINYESLERT